MGYNSGTTDEQVWKQLNMFHTSTLSVASPSQPTLNGMSIRERLTQRRQALERELIQLNKLEELLESLPAGIKSEDLRALLYL